LADLESRLCVNAYRRTLLKKGSGAILALTEGR
jgi:hypothetical protein